MNSDWGGVQRTQWEKEKAQQVYGRYDGTSAKKLRIGTQKTVQFIF